MLVVVPRAIEDLSILYFLDPNSDSKPCVSTLFTTQRRPIVNTSRIYLRICVSFFSGNKTRLARSLRRRRSFHVVSNRNLSSEAVNGCSCFHRAKERPDLCDVRNSFHASEKRAWHRLPRTVRPCSSRPSVHPFVPPSIHPSIHPSARSIVDGSPR